MKGRILQVFTAIVLIITMTMANVLLLGMNVISYAAEAISGEDYTNQKNVAFSAHLVDGDGNGADRLEVKMNAENLKLHLKIEVKKEGYFNGTVKLLDGSNFKLKTDILSEGITKIEGNTIYLSQINAGEAKEFDIGIEPIKDDLYDLSMRDMESKLSIDGIYMDSSEKENKLIGERAVTLVLKSPYDESFKGITLSEELITNKVSYFGDAQKRMIQIQVTAGMENNLYPMYYQILEMTAPKINDKYPEQVMISSMDELIINGKELSDEDWVYDSSTGKTTITLRNDPNSENKVVWNKAGMDKYIITYIYSDTTALEKQPIPANLEVGLHDLNGTVAKSKYEIQPSGEEKDGMISINIENQENEIAKGKLYAGIEREFTENINVNITAPNIASEVRVQENLSTMGLQNVKQRRTVISKQNMIDILGENGQISIYNVADNSLVTVINRDSVEDKDGNIQVNYADIDSVYFVLSQPVNSGKLVIKNTKVIGQNSEDTVRALTGMNYTLEGSYKIQGMSDTALPASTATIQLKEAETSARIEVNRTDLSAMMKNEDVEIRVIMQTRDEKNELYKNPTVRIVLPDKFQEIDVKDIHLLYADGMEITNAVLNGNVIEIQITGEQMKYTEEAIEGPTIIINADITVDRKSGSSQEAIGLIYTNEKAHSYPEGKAQGETNTIVNIVSYKGMVTTIETNNYGINVINNDGTKTGTLPLGTAQNIVSVSNQILNNTESVVSDIRILGTFPTEGAVEGNDIATSVSGITLNGIGSERYKVYYSSNATATTNVDDVNNQWSETLADGASAKKYLIVINSMENQEQISFGYDVTIPANLEYNQVAKQGYGITYTNNSTSLLETTSLDQVSLETPKGPVVEANLKAYVGKDEASSVKRGEILTYEIEIANTGSEDVSDVTASATVPDGMVYVEEIVRGSDDGDDNPEGKLAGFLEKEDIKDVTFTIDNLKVGETVTRTYMVRAKNDAENLTQISNKATITYGEVIKESNYVVTNVAEGKLSIALSNVEIKSMTDNIQSGYAYRYYFELQNISDEKLENVNLVIDSSELEIMSYAPINTDMIVSDDNKTYTIPSMEAGEERSITIEITMPIFPGESHKLQSLSAKATVNGDEYKSNNKDLIIHSANVSVDITSPNAGEYVEDGQDIVYNINVKNNNNERSAKIQVIDEYSDDVSIKSVKLNGQELSEENGYILWDLDTRKIEFDDLELPASGEVNYEIIVTPNRIPGNTEVREIINTVELDVSGIFYDSATISHIVEPEVVEPDPTEIPTITLSQNSSNLKQIDVTVQDTDSNIDVVKWVEGSYDISFFREYGSILVEDSSESTINTSFVISRTGMYTVYAKDATGNEVIEGINITSIEDTPGEEDIEPPEITVSQNKIDESNLELTILAEDNMNEIDIVKITKGEQTEVYFQNNGEEVEINKDGNSAMGTFNVIENGTYTVYARDALGNETVKVFEVTALEGGSDPGTDPGDPDDPGEETESKIISGTAWLDEDENGEKGSTEQKLSGIIVRVLNTRTNEFLTDRNGNIIEATTNNNGFYSITGIPQGEYIVVFEYDTQNYRLTDYEKAGIDSNLTSKAINTTMEINGENKEVGATEIIRIEDSNIANVNIGLKEAKIFDLKLDKEIGRIVIQNSKGTSTQDFEDGTTFAKAEIDSKLLNGTTAVVEYNIKITNEGEVDAYVRNIVDNVSSEYQFSSEMNKDWYEQGGKLYNSSLANEKIAPGETKTLTLVLTKQMTENNLGRIGNTAEIVESYNEQGLTEKDSIAGNNVQGEDDLGSADVIFSIKTGEIVATVFIVITSIVVLAGIAIVITRYIYKRKI